MVFNELVDEEDDVTQCTDYYKNISCSQYIPEQLTRLIENNYSFLRLKMRSLNKHHEDLVSLLTNTGCSLDVIGCSET